MFELAYNNVEVRHVSDYATGRLYQGLRFHSQGKDGTNPTSIRHT